MMTWPTFGRPDWAVTGDPMPRKLTTAKRGAKSLDDVGITGLLDLLVGCHPGQSGVPWATWAALFADYRAVRTELLAKYPTTAAGTPPWAEGALARWKRNPRSREFSESYADMTARQVAEQRADAHEYVEGAKAAGTWPETAPCAATEGTRTAQTEDNDVEV